MDDEDMLEEKTVHEDEEFIETENDELSDETKIQSMAWNVIKKYFMLPNFTNIDEIVSFSSLLNDFY